MFYKTLQQNKQVTISRNAEDFLIIINPNIDIKKKNEMFAKNAPRGTATEIQIQNWFNKLNWESMGLTYTTFSFDTHVKPLTNGRKPDASHIGRGYAKSEFNVACVCDLKNRDKNKDSFSPDDKGKAVALAQSIWNTQKEIRTAGVPSYLCDGTVIMFFIYSEDSSGYASVRESPPLYLNPGQNDAVDGGVWLLSLLTTPIVNLGLKLPIVKVSDRLLPWYGYLGSGASSRVLLSEYEGNRVAVKWREKMSTFDPEDNEFRVLQVINKKVPDAHIPKLVARSDCGKHDIV